jgi:enoyl-CoA hydratase/carnithine racemase
MGYQNILFQIKDSIARITLNQPEKRNPLSKLTMSEILNALEISKKDDNARVIIITGAGEKAFCAGANLTEFTGNNTMESRELFGLYAKVCLAFTTLGKPSIAAVKGLALAGGCGLALYPDITIATENAKFGVPEINVGVWPMMVSASMLRTVGRKKTLELMCLGEIIDAREALSIGLINRIVPDDQLEDAVNKIAGQLISKSSAVLKLGIESFYTMSDMEYSKAVMFLREMVTQLMNTEDTKEGVTAFMEKRKPVWKDQ